jgi:hypothetical protein
MKLDMIWMIIGAAGAVSGAGWGAHEYVDSKLASKEEVQIAGGKVDYLIERREEALVREISELERTKDLTPTQLEHLRSLRRQLEEVRRVRRGK